MKTFNSTIFYEVMVAEMYGFDNLTDSICLLSGNDNSGDGKDDFPPQPYAKGE